MLASEKLALEDWLKISESLRKYDLLIEQSRRDSGQLVPRAEAEQACCMAATWLRLAVAAFKNNYAQELGRNPAANAKLIDLGMSRSVKASMKKAPDCRAAMPPWAIKAVLEGYNIYES